MGIQNLSKSLVLVGLRKEPEASVELENINEIVSKQCDFDVIVDFSILQIIRSSSISNLLVLRNLVSGSGHRLILYSVSFLVKCVFRVAGLNEVFEFADDKHTAVDALNSSSESVN